jgi:competence ComEA-like helix-hairpin-helix protein
MRMNSPHIKINTASPDEIAALRGISLRLAKRIVAYRDAHGPFHGPEYLAKVEGISGNLVKTLAYQIDWEVPLQPEPLQERRWLDAFYWGVILLVLLLSVLSIVVALLSPIARNTLVTGPGYWLKIFATSLGTIILFAFAIFASTRIGVFVTREKEQARRFSRFGLKAMAIALICGLFFVSSVVAYIQIYSDNGWLPLANKQNGWILPVGLISFITLYFLMIPQLVVLLKPELAANRWISSIFDISIGISGLMLIAIISTNIFPFWLLLLCSLAGLFVVIIATVSIRRGESFFQASLDFIDPRVLTRKQMSTDNWRTWLNANAPGSERQKALRDALNEIYRPSPTQTFLRVFVLGIGGWLVLTAISAIIELYVQNWWEGLFK